MNSRTTRLILLGTGSGPTPKRGRKPPGHVLRVDGASYLIECGNGVGGQLVAADVPLSSLTAVFITHHHIDHMADFGNLFFLSWSQLEKPVEVFAPPPITRMFEAFFELHASEIEHRQSQEGRRSLRELVRDHEVIAVSEPVFEDERVRVTGAVVDHPPLEQAYAYRFDTADRSVVFSGDTVPSDALIELARGCDVLVHEAFHGPTLEASFQDYNAPGLVERMRRAHTQVEDAAAVAEKAGAVTLVLSPLAPAPGIDDDTWRAAAATQFGGEIIVGADLLEI